MNIHLQRLLEGNRRFVAGKPEHPHQSHEHRTTLLGEQSPFAAIVGCTDSRVPPELIFDQGFGDLYISRVGGSIVGDLAIASLEIGVIAFGIEFILVLGHSGCGAIRATIHGQTTAGSLPALAEMIQPAIDEARSLPGDLWTNTIQINARRTARRLVEHSPVLSEAVASGQIAIATGYYDLATGVVSVLEADVPAPGA